MQAVVKARAEPGLGLEEVSVPEARGDDVLIRVLKTSICGTDVHIYNWDAWAQKTIPVPMTIGHEFVGVVDLVVVTESFVTFVSFSYSEINSPRGRRPGFVPQSRGCSVVRKRIDYLGARELTIFSKRGSPRSGSQNGSRWISP
jgi:Alcohol dehydrogenase GroES-like domain